MVVLILWAVIIPTQHIDMHVTNKPVIKCSHKEKEFKVFKTKNYPNSIITKLSILDICLVNILPLRC